MRSKALISIAAPMALSAALVVPAGVALATATPSPTATPGVDCAVVAVGTANTSNQPDSRFTVSGGVVTGKVKVTGGVGCRQVVTIATWQAPDGNKGLPYSDQKLFNHATATFGPGEHTISTPLPNCFFQVDLVRGAKPTDDNGGPLYGKDRMMGSLHGGTQPCASPSPSPTPSPTATPTPTPIVTPLPTPSSTPAVLGTSTQPTLPQTGAELGGLVGFGSMVGASYAYLRSRKSLRDSLK